MNELSLSCAQIIHTIHYSKFVRFLNIGFLTQAVSFIKQDTASTSLLIACHVTKKILCGHNKCGMILPIGSSLSVNLLKFKHYGMYL